MTTIAPTPKLGDGIVSSATALEITVDLPFNEWRRLGERLLETTDRALWSIGDWREYGRRYEREYHDALEAIDSSSRLPAACARVARAFEPERRRGQLSFELHELVASLPRSEQDVWLDDAERQGWGRRQMQLELGEALERAPVAAISIRAVGELHELIVRAAQRRGLKPREWALLVLEEAARAELALEEAA